MLLGKRSCYTEMIWGFQEVSSRVGWNKSSFCLIVLLNVFTLLFSILNKTYNNQNQEGLICQELPLIVFRKEQLFLKISEISQKKTSIGVPFNRVAGLKSIVWIFLCFGYCWVLLYQQTRVSFFLVSISSIETVRKSLTCFFSFSMFFC